MVSASTALRDGQASAARKAIDCRPAFQNMSGDPEQEYFSDGMTEDLITDLSKVSGLFVIARNSSFAYKGRSVKVQEIGRDLGVRFVLEGSVRKAGNRVRITAQLIDASNGGHLWAERFDRDLTDIFSTQDEVVEKIVGTLAVTLTQREERRLHRHRIGDVAAYESWLRARELLSRGTKESLAQAKAMYSVRSRSIGISGTACGIGARLGVRQRLGVRSGAGAGRGGEMGPPRGRIERSGAGEPHGARQRVVVAAKSRGSAHRVSPHDRARSQLCSGPRRARTGPDVCRPRDRGARADRDRDAARPSIRHAAALPGAGELPVWENTKSAPSSSSSASHAIPAPTPAACCWHPATAISGAWKTRSRAWAELLKVNPEFSLMRARPALQGCRGFSAHRRRSGEGRVAIGKPH